MKINPIPKDRARIVRNQGVDGFTFVEVCVIVVFFVFVVAGAALAHRQLGGAAGLVLGAISGAGFFFLGMFGCGALLDFSVGGIPRLPKCRDGTCRGPRTFSRNYGDYHSQKFGNEYNYVCKHGGRYKRVGRRFVSINDHGTEIPYLVWRPFRGWFPDEGPA